MINFLSFLILFYPSVPNFRVGWGQNIPFFVISLVLNWYFLRRKGFKIDKTLFLILFSIPLVVAAVYIMREKVGYFNWVVPLVGIRELTINFSILLSIFLVAKNYNSSFLFKGLLCGLIFNLLYGLLEVVYQPISEIEFIFHAPNKNDDYLLNEVNPRIRLLWITPTMAATYLAMALPLVFVIKDKLKRFFLLFCWTAAFVKVGSKGVLLFLLLTPVVAFILSPLSSTKFLLKRLWLIALLATTGLFAAIFLQSELQDSFFYVLEIAQFMLSPESYTLNMDELYAKLYRSNVGESQYIRFVVIAIAIQNFISEPYALITGFSPWGAKFYYIFNPEFVPSYLKIATFTTRFNSEELNVAKPIVESSFIDIYVSYGLPMLLFMIISLYVAYKKFKLLLPRYKESVSFIFIWILLSNLFMLTENAFVLFYVYKVMAEKLLAEKEAKKAKYEEALAQQYQEEYLQNNNNNIKEVGFA